MSEETITDTQDSQVTDPVVEGDVSAPAPEADSVDAIAEKRLRDTQAKMTELAQENATLRTEQQKFQTEYLAEVHKVVTRESAPRQLSREEEEARLDKLADDWGISREAVLEIGNMKADAIEAAKSANEATLSEIRQSQEALQQSMSELREAQDPVYQQNKPTVDKMVEAGLTRQQAMIALKVVPRGPVVEAGSPSPGGIGNGTVAPSNVGNQQSSDDVIRDYLKVVPDATPEEIAAVRKMGVGLQRREEWQMPGGVA